MLCLSPSPPHSSTLRWLIVSACLACVLASSAPVKAQDADNSARAEALYITAIKLYNEGRNREAVAKFDEAIALDPRPIFHCNRAAVLLKVNELDRAITDLTLCRDEYATDASERAQIDAQLLAITLVDASILRTSRQLAARIANPPVLVRAPAEPVQAAPTGPSALRLTGYATLATGSALMIGAGVLDLSSAPTRRRFESASKPGTETTRAEYEMLRAQLRTRQVWFYSLGLGGIALNTVGIGALILDGIQRDTQRASLTLMPSRQGVTLHMGLAF